MSQNGSFDSVMLRVSALGIPAPSRRRDWRGVTAIGKILQGLSSTSSRENNRDRVAIIVGGALLGPATALAAPRNGPAITVEVSSLDELRSALDRATPGSVIRLAAGIYQIYSEDHYILVKDVKGLPDQPIIIQGSSAGEDGKRPKIIDGGRSLSPAVGAAGALPTSGQPADPTP
jgi:hypothetical protein